MKAGDIVKVTGGALRGAIGTIEEDDKWGHYVRLWGDEKPEPRHFPVEDLAVLQPATARTEILADLAQVNRAIQSYDVYRARGMTAPSFSAAKKGLEQDRQVLLEMLAELEEKTT